MFCVISHALFSPDAKDSPEQIANKNKLLNDENDRLRSHNTQLQKDLDDCNEEIRKLTRNNRTQENKIDSLQTKLDSRSMELLKHKQLTMKGEACTILNESLASKLQIPLASILGGLQAQRLHDIVHHGTYNQLGRYFIRPHLADPPTADSNCPIDIFECRVLPLAEDMYFALNSTQNERNHQNHLVIEELIPSVVNQMKDDLENSIGIKGVNDSTYNYVRKHILEPAFNDLKTKLEAKAREQHIQATTLARSPRFRR